MHNIKWRWPLEKVTTFKLKYLMMGYTFILTVKIPLTQKYTVKKRFVLSILRKFMKIQYNLFRAAHDSKKHSFIFKNLWTNIFPVSKEAFLKQKFLQLLVLLKNVSELFLTMYQSVSSTQYQLCYFSMFVRWTWKCLLQNWWI